MRKGLCSTDHWKKHFHLCLLWGHLSGLDFILGLDASTF